MRVVMEFDLPDDDFEHKAAVAGVKLAYALQEVDARLRSMHKYEDKDSINIETVRSMLRDETEDVSWLWE